MRASQLPAAIDLEPDLVVVAASGNDVLARDFAPEAVEVELRTLLRPLATRFDRLDDLTRDVCVAVGGVHIENHAHPRATDPGIFAGDRIHANARGHAISAATLTAGLHVYLQGRADREGATAVDRGEHGASLS